MPKKKEYKAPSIENEIYIPIEEIPGIDKPQIDQKTSIRGYRFRGVLSSDPSDLKSGDVWLVASGTVLLRYKTYWKGTTYEGLFSTGD